MSFVQYVTRLDLGILLRKIWGTHGISQCTVIRYPGDDTVLDAVPRRFDLSAHREPQRFYLNPFWFRHDVDENHRMRQLLVLIFIPPRLSLSPRIFPIALGIGTM